MSKWKRRLLWAGSLVIVCIVYLWFFGPQTPADRAAGLSSIILIKAIMPPTTDWAIYKIQSQKFRGFQLGDPARHPKKMCLELYGDDVHFEINIEQNTGSPGPGIIQPAA